MRSQRRWFDRWIAVALVAGVVASCGGDDDGGAAPSTGISSEVTTEPDSAPSSSTTDVSDGDDDTEETDPASSPTTTGATAVPVRGGSYTFGAGPDVATFDPHAAQAGQQFTSYLTLVYDGLVFLDEDFELQPALATSWELVEPTRLEFTLRDDVAFSDGTLFDADVAKANLERALAADGPRANLISRIESIDAPDPTSLILHLSRPDGTLLRSLASSPGLMVSPAAFENTDLDRVPVGTGPYELDTALSTPGSEYVFTARADYFQPDWQRVDEIKVRPIQSSTARFNALRSGEVDVALIGATEADAATAEGFELAQAINRFEGLTIVDRNGALVPAFADARVRRAIGYAIDREALVDAVFFGHAAPATQPFAEGEPGHTDELDESYDYDPDRARELLAEAGFADGFSFTYPTEEGGSTLATAIQGFLAAVGIDMQIELQEAGSLGQVGRSTDYPVITIGYPARDPDSRAQAIWASAAAFNPFGVEVPELDQLAADASASTDDAERHDLFSRYAEIVVSEGYTVVLLNPFDLVAHDTDAVGVAMSGFYDPMLRLISVSG